MGERHRESVEVPLEDWVRQIVRTTSQEVLDTHQKKCPIDRMMLDVWGLPPDRPGIKDNVTALQGRVASLEGGRRGFLSILRQIVVPIVVAVLTAALFWAASLGGRSIAEESPHGRRPPPATQRSTP